MVVPIDADIDEAQHVAGENWQHRQKRRQIDAVGHFQLQHHDGDDDGEHAVAEGFEAVGLHPAIIPESGRRGNRQDLIRRVPFGS